MANKRPLVMTNEDWQKHRNATECRVCNKSLIKDLFLDSISVHDPNSGKYRGKTTEDAASWQRNSSFGRKEKESRKMKLNN